MVITIDTNILLWGLRGVSKAGQEDMIVRAKAFFEDQRDRGTFIVLTSECVAEYLVGEDKADRRKTQMDDLQAKFMIIPYDTKAAAIAAEIRSDKTFIQSLKDDVGITRTCIKSDIVIAATAKAFRKSGVDIIYSNDCGLRKIAEKCGISARDLPTIEELTLKLQPTGVTHSREITGNLFGDDE